jgi:hypothetical protein
MILSMLKWCVFCMALIVLGCASNGQIRDFTYNPSTEETFPEVQEAELYKNGVDRPHQVIGEVAIKGELGEDEESLENRLLNASRKIGAEGVIVIETGRLVSEVGKAGVRHDQFGGAATDYRYYPPPVTIQEESIYIKGMAIRFSVN